MRGKLALLALLLALAALVVPADAYELASFSRSASATIVTASNGYNAISVESGCDQGLTAQSCTITITNKATTQQTYTVSEDPDNTFVSSYKIDSSSSVSSGRVTAPSATNVGGTSTVTLTLTTCTLGCTTKFGYYTIEGEKAGSLSSMQTKIRVQIN